MSAPQFIAVIFGIFLLISMWPPLTYADKSGTSDVKYKVALRKNLTIEFRVRRWNM